MIPPPAFRGVPKAYVYLLRSLSTGTFYLGWTTDLQRRLQQHNSGLSPPHTRTRGPWELLAYEVHPSSAAAKDRERTLKHRHRMRHFFIKRALDAPKGAALRVPRQVGG